MVSVVIPAFNAGLYVAEAIKSVRSQTYPQIECIVVDDGSTDMTADAITSFGPAVRYQRQSNQGVSSARNAGARSARGAFVAFLDADDIWLPRKLERQMALFEQGWKLGLVYCGLHMVDEGLNFSGSLSPADASHALRNTLLLEKPFMVGIGSTALLPVEVFNEVGGFNEELSVSADCDFACRVALAHNVRPVFEPLILYRQHKDQMHLDPTNVQLDMEDVFERFFNDPLLPEDLRRLRGRAEANLAVSLAGHYLARGDVGVSLGHLGKAGLQRPNRLVNAIWRRMRPGGPPGGFES